MTRNLLSPMPIETQSVITDAPLVQGALQAVDLPRLVRPEFVSQMEAELQANQHKGDWRRWYPTPLQVLAEIQHHQGKLMLALSAGDCERVKEYAADLANFAMKVDEQFGGPNAEVCQPEGAKKL